MFACAHRIWAQWEAEARSRGDYGWGANSREGLAAAAQRVTTVLEGGGGNKERGGAEWREGGWRRESQGGNRRNLAGSFEAWMKDEEKKVTVLSIFVYFVREGKI